jgi:hypothetical protein
MNHLCDAIGEMLLEGAEFENAYSLVIAAGDVQATTWIKFCVQCATLFDDPPEDSEFLSVLESSAGNRLERDDFWSQIKQLQLKPFAWNKRLHRC